MQRAFIALLTLCLLAAPAFAQTTTGRLVGTVSGPDGVLAGASVVVKDNQTGRELTVAAKEDGTFVFPQLESGTYTVTITSPGFKTHVSEQVKIDVGREYSLNPTLEIGGVSETVTVTAGADIINATSPTLSNTVSPKQIQELPLNARNPLNLINLQPGTTPSVGFQGTTINGMRTTMTNVTRDGINIQDAFIRTNATDFVPGRPSVDDTGEFTISTGLSDADSGYGGAQVRLVTPRGESQLHGALFAYNRNSHFAANTFFNNRAGSFGPNDAAVLQGRARAGDPRSPRPFRNRNQYGGRVAGPLWLPHFGEGGSKLIKDKAFFFFNYEGLRDPVTTIATRTILTPSARAGTFTFNATCTAATCPAGVTPGQQRTVSILDFARSLGLNNIPSTIDPVVQSRILAGVPTAGNRTDIGDQLNTTGFQVNRASDQTRDQYVTRLDFDLNDRHSISGIWSWNKEVNLRPDGDTNPITTSYTVQPFVDQSSENKQLTLAYRSTITSNFINEVRGGFFKSDVPFNRLAPLPAFFITPTLINSPESQFLNQGRKTANYTISDNADYIAGNHAFRFGGVFQFFKLDVYNDAGTVPTYTLGTGGAAPSLQQANFASLGGISTAQLGTANGLLALLGGITTGGTQTFNTESRTSGFKPTTLLQPYEYGNHSFFFQDRWRPTPSLSLTLGLRYELFTPLRQTNGLVLEPLIPEGADPVSTILNPIGTYTFLGTNAGSENAFHKLDKDNFAPTIGFAWSPNFKNRFLGALFGGEGRTTIRGGYGIIYANDSLVTTLRNAGVGNVGLGSTAGLAFNTVTGQTPLNDRLGSGLTPITAPTFITPPRSFIQNNRPPVASNFGTVFAIDPNLETPQVDQWSLGFQRELGFQTALEVRYVGTRSNNLWRSVDYNQINIFQSGFLADFERARANLSNTGNAFCNPATTANCQALNIFRLTGAGVTPGVGQLIVGTASLSTATFNNNLANGTPADLALSFIQNGLNGGPTLANPTAPQFVNLLPNPGTGVANLFQNGGFYTYHALQAEVRRRFANGLYFQANYTFSKNLTDAIGTSQQLVEPFLDINNKDLDRQRADYDLTHVFNFNGIYELPFGRGKRFFSGSNGLVNHLLGGWQINSIVSLTSGSPITFTDTRGTLNRAGRSARQTPNSSLSVDEIQGLVGFYDTPCGLFYINPAVLNLNTTTCVGSGRASEGFGTTPFAGQVFFNVAPGRTGNLQRSIVNGPNYFNLDASLIKNIYFKESMKVQLRMEAFNALNNVNFFPAGQVLDITSTNFGRLTQTTGARVLQFAARFEF